MSTTAPASVCIGIPGPQAIVLAGEIDAATASAATLCQAGFPYPVAVEIARQCVTGTGDIEKLRQCGMSTELATAIKTAIDA